MGFSCTTERSGGVITVTPVGDIDLATAPVLRECLREVVTIADVDQIEVDLSRVLHLDSSGIGVLVAAYKAAAAHGAVLRLHRPGPVVRMVLEVTNLVDLLVAPDDR